MLFNRPLRRLLLALACSAALAAQAQTAPRLDIPAGDLAAALATYAQQTGTQLIYRADQLRGAHSNGLRGQSASPQALDALLSGSGFRAQRDASGAVLILPAAAAPAAPARPARPAPPPQAQSEGPVTQLEAVQVTGSRIPRAQIEGPAPITVVSSEQIQAAGFTSVPEVLRSLSQNSGSVQGQQNTTSAQSTPGAQAVDLRGIGPNHTLVLVNGRRIADFPLPLEGKSNFTDIGSIPLGMIDRIEILTGSASAVYGSDAMAGVINFILKKSADGTTIDYRYGDTSHGGGASHDLTLTTGFENGNFTGIVGIEFQDKQPLWGFQRRVQDSTLDAPNARRRLPRVVASIYDWDDDVNIMPANGCTALSTQEQGSVVLTHDRWGEPYCGSERAIAYRTIQNERKGVNFYGSFEYQFSGTLSWFADVQAGRQTVRLLTGVPGGSNEFNSDHMGWQFQDPAATDSNDGMFYNANTGHYEVWTREFTLEEVGGLRSRMNTTVEMTFGLTTGLKGAIGENWDWELSYNYSRYKADVSMPRINAEAANTYFLGPRLGYDADGYAIYAPDPANLFTPLTPAQFATLGAMSVFHPKAANNNLSFTVNTPVLFTLPAGDVGFAGVVEYGSQSYRINPDPLALTDTDYYGPRYGDGHGSRNHWDVAGELRMPLFSTLQASLAGRYDQYSYGGQNPGKFTYSLGLEWRPVDTLLVRGSYGTGFRAPDMHYLFAGNDYYRRTSTDYFQCRTDDPSLSDADCYDDGSWDIATRDVYAGNRNLQVETSKSATIGFVWSPTSNFDLAIDYYSIRIDNQVQTQSRDLLLITDGNCRLGITDTGAAVDVHSPSCLDAMARVVRNGNGEITSVLFGPINIAHEQTSGIDLTFNYRLDTANAGSFRFNGNYNWTHRHTRNVYPGDPTEDMLDVGFSDTTLPRTKGNLGVNWERGAWGAGLFGNYLGRVANYTNTAWTQSTWRFNASARYNINDHFQVALSIDNLLDQMPPKDPTWDRYPYYDTSWFDSFGRSFFLQFTYKFGGQPL